MQPCAVCGGVTINATGHCTQCGTFRGNPPQDAAGGYGYQHPVSGPGYQQPVSSPGYGQPPPGGYPVSVPPGAYPGSGGPAYSAPISGGGYPGGYPPPPGNDANRAKPFVVPLVALSATLVVLVVAIVVVVIVRSGGQTDDPLAGPTTPAGPTANPDVDPCVVGTWKVTSHTETVTMEDIGEVRFTGGAGGTLELTADGSGTTTYNATTFEGTGEGQTIKLEISGSVTYDFTARNGTVSTSNVRSTATYSSYLNGDPVETDQPFEASDDPANYTCSGHTMTQSTDLYETRFTKTG
jgi:hypothetical protein